MHRRKRGGTLNKIDPFLPFRFDHKPEDAIKATISQIEIFSLLREVYLCPCGCCKRVLLVNWLSIFRVWGTKKSFQHLKKLTQFRFLSKVSYRSSLLHWKQRHINFHQKVHRNEYFQHLLAMKWIKNCKNIFFQIKSRVFSETKPTETIFDCWEPTETRCWSEPEMSSTTWVCPTWLKTSTR